MVVMLTKNTPVSGSTLIGFQHVKPCQRSTQILLHNPPTKLAVKGFQTLSSYTRLQKYGNNSRKYKVYNSLDPGSSPSGPPPNILSWIVALAMGAAIPVITYKWGPLLKKKVEEVMQLTENVAEAVEKVAEEVEKVAEDIADDLPEGRLRKAVDFVENLAERTAKDAGKIDDFIDKVQEEEEKAESTVVSLKEANRPTKETNEEKANEEKANDQNYNLDK